MIKTHYGSGVTADTKRGPSGAIWKDCKVLEMIEDPTKGVYFFDDFLTKAFTMPTTEANYGIWKAFGSSGATITDADEVGGVIKLTEATDDESIAIMQPCEPFQLIRTGGKLWFEARIKTSSVANTAHNFIIGLADRRTLIVGDPIDTSGVLISTLNFVGFQRLEADGDAMDTTSQENGETQVVHQADAITLAADTWVKVGFTFNPKDGLLTFYQNGVPRSTTVTVSETAGSAFPNDVRLGIIMAHMSAASSPGTDSIDWVRCAQESTDA